MPLLDRNVHHGRMLGDLLAALQQPGDEQVLRLELSEGARHYVSVQAEFRGECFLGLRAVRCTPDAAGIGTQAVRSGSELVIDEDLVLDFLNDQIMLTSNRLDRLLRHCVLRMPVSAVPEQQDHLPSRGGQLFVDRK